MTFNKRVSSFASAITESALTKGKQAENALSEGVPMESSYIFNTILTIGFGSALLLFFKIQKNLMGHPSRVFFCLFLWIYFLVGVSNVLKHRWITDFIDRYKHYFELLFPPTLLFIFIFPMFALYIFSVFMKQEMANRLHAEETLRKSEEKFRNLFEHALEGVAISHEDQVVAANRSMLELMGYDNFEEFAQVPISDRIATEYRELFRAKTCVGEGGEVLGQRYECRIIRKNGEIRDVGISSGSISIGTNRYIQVCIRDITMRKRIEHELDATRAFLQSVIDGVAETIMVVGVDYRIRLINEAARKIHQIDLPLASSQTCYTYFHRLNEPCREEDHPCPLRAVMKTKKPVVLIHDHVRLDGTKYVAEVAASPLLNEDDEVTGIIEIGRDVTEKLRMEEERKKIEARMFQQQKDRSIATLAKGVAHDFNNMLGTVQGNVELLQMGKVDLEEQCGMIEAIGSAAHRMIELTSQLLAYAKEGAYQLKILDIKTLIIESLKISRTGRDSRVMIDLKLEDGLWTVVADPGQMSQMLVNIFTNAFEAMENSGGCLSIRASNKTKHEEWECLFHDKHPAGEYSYIGISDTGPGIEQKVDGRIFEPFVTTKFLGRGLGLAAAAGIIRNHHGCISVDSMNNGTTFHILLPHMGQLSSS